MILLIVSCIAAVYIHNVLEVKLYHSKPLTPLGVTWFGVALAGMVKVFEVLGEFAAEWVV